MSTTVKTKTETKLSRRGAVRMHNGKCTWYLPSVCERAFDLGVALICMAMGKEVLRKPQIKHRRDLFAVFGDLHERAGEGRYIAREAWEKDAIDKAGNVKIGGHLTGAQHVNPYLSDERNYASLVTTFLKQIPSNIAKGLRAVSKKDLEFGESLRWLGKRDGTGAVAVTPWFTWEKLFELAQKDNPAMLKWLKSVKSGKRGVKTHLGPLEKFKQNIDVMHRARRKFHAVTGDVEVGGGNTPYAMPLEQVEYAIDIAFLTDSFEVVDDPRGGQKINPLGEYYVRFAIGRSNPYVILYREWLGASDDSKVTFLDENVRERFNAAKKRLKSAKAA